MISIPIFSTSSADFTQTIELDTTIVTLRLKYNIRNANWFMSVSTENYQLNDIKLVSNFQLLHQYKANFPELPGDFFVIKTNETTEDTEITYENLGNDFLLLYLSPEEVEQWREENGL